VLDTSCRYLISSTYVCVCTPVLQEQDQQCVPDIGMDLDADDLMWLFDFFSDEDINFVDMLQ
jgi:hypothetical protein